MAIMQECPYCHRKQSVAKKKCVSCGSDLDREKKNRKVRYHIVYRLPDGKQKWESVGSFDDLSPYSIEDAKKAMAKRNIQKAENRILDIKQDTKLTFSDLSKWYLGLEGVKALASYRGACIRLSKFNTRFGDTLLSVLKKADIEGYQTHLQGEGLSHAYIDNIITQAHVMVKAAYSNDMISHDALKPFIVTKQLLKKNSNARDRILSWDEFEKLRAVSSAHLKGILTMAFFTGMRKREILSLTWDRIDLDKREIRLEAMDTKTGQPRTCPIGEELLRLLQCLPSRLKCKHVFIYKGQPCKDIKKSLQGACKLAGIPYGRNAKNGFTFHDIRHTFNTCARKAGVSEGVIMALTGHETREMFDRYNKIDSEDINQAMTRIEKALKRNVR